MPYRNMSLDDFARHTGMDARDVQKLAERGRLPGQKIGGQWRFNRARVTEWLQQEVPSLDAGQLETLERAMSDEGSDRAMIVTDLIGIEGVEAALRANTKGSLLRELVGLAERTGLIYDADGLLQAIEAREEMCSTGLPHGIAIPHPRQPMPYATAEPLVCVARTTRGIGFGSPYGDLTRLFFLICCHEDRHHLRVLARLMRILSIETIEAALAAQEPGDLLEVLIAREREIA
jgi:PTS system nitrogen regulatory IIA component